MTNFLTDLTILPMSELKGLNLPSLLMNKYSLKPIESYKFFTIIPYDKYSTRTSGIRKHQAVLDISVYEVRISTLYLSPVILAQSKEDLEKVLDDSETLVKRKIISVDF